MDKLLLGGLTASAFLRRHWQKQPLLVRGAIPGFEGMVDFGGMVDLACRDDCESRLVVRHADRWTVEHGPFDRKRFSRLPRRNWTLLLQGLEQRLPAARLLLSHFDFIPYSRLDDLMVSYAPSGGGVGAHFDSYDVFLLQGPGQRLWQVGRQRDLTLLENAPLKILKRFRPDGQCLLSTGDMLYLPPEFAHDGAAVSACYTYSIGFRAPSHRELMSQFLIFLEEKLQSGGRYGDPDLSPQIRPAQLGAGMIEKVEHILGGIRWTRRDVAVFLGSYLTEPKPHVLFAPPRKPLSEIAFSRAARRNGVDLALASMMLYARANLFINGEQHRMDAGLAKPMRCLADARRLPGWRITLNGPLVDTLYRWYRAGYIYLSGSGAAGRQR
ncbi:MAG TPA: cupin domain-containing protein [Burkholderiales bacterium]|nr:cupin domain-containing protein [Burkholderiales bacterium]